jgi:membrane fusion protein, multidrug efflux system
MAAVATPVSSRQSSAPKAGVETSTGPRTAAPGVSPAEGRVATSPTAAAPSRRKLLFAGLALLVAAAGGGRLWMLRNIESTDDAQIDADIVAVPARTGGIVSRVLFAENQRVVQGELLAELEPAPAQARLDQAEATLAAARAAATAADAKAALSEGNAQGNLAVARAGLQTTNAGALGTEESIREGSAAVDTARARLAEAESNLLRARSLIASGAYAQAQLDQAQSARDVVATELAQAEARLAALRLSRNQAQSRVVEAAAKLKQSDQVAATVSEARALADQAHAQVALASAARELAALELSYTKIYAPSSGTVSRKSINVGQSVAAGQSIVQLVPDARWVTANFKETQLAAMRVGQPVSLTVDAYPGVTFHGQVESLAAATGARFSLLPPDNATGNFTKVVQRIPVRVRVLAPPSAEQLVPGMSVAVDIDTRGPVAHSGEAQAHAAQAAPHGS